MKQLFLSFFIIYSTSSLLAQRKSIGMEVFDKWPSVWEPKISNDGKYALYRINNEPVYSQTIVIKSLKDNWEKKLPGVRSAFFSDDSQKAIFIQGEDSLGLLNLGGQYIEYIDSVRTFKLYSGGEKEWIVYQLNTSETPLILMNVKNGEKRTFINVAGYKFDEKGNALAFIEESEEENDKLQILKLINFYKNEWREPKAIWKGMAISNIALDAQNKQLAFMAEDLVNDKSEEAVFYYKAGMRHAIRLMGGQLSNLEIETLDKFSIDGKRLFITLKEAGLSQSIGNGAMLDIWSYADVKLQSQQLVNDVPGNRGYYIGPGSYVAVLDIKQRKIIRLQKEDEEINLISNGENDDWALVIKREGNDVEESWNKHSPPLYYLVSVKTGERKEVLAPFATLSPRGKYLIGKDSQSNFFSYELETGLTRKIVEAGTTSKGVAGRDDVIESQHSTFIFENKWLDKDAAMMLCDEYDIWQVDPQGRETPINLTNNYGRTNNIMFRFIENGQKTYNINEELILDAFDNKNKNNGFYSIKLGKSRNPKEITMGPYIFYCGAYFYLGGERPVKARDAKVYVVRRCSATQSANYFWTIDFKDFVSISRVYPERQYNWLVSELIKFKTFEGQEEHGILYKPENFNPKQKYPVILSYYESKSERLNQYFRPYYSDGDINIPYFVSRGYLVFTPDISYTLKGIGQSALGSIVAAGQYLADLPWVDARRMGISGHSFGGFETNYVITHSDLFAAACADAGMTNFISQYGSYELNSGVSLQDINERGQNKMNGTLWQMQDSYIKNSPIFQVHKVETPVLLVSNKLDAIVHFSQEAQFFTALRRLNKKAWLLQYDGEQHSLLKKKNKADLNVRITQFFDHYLKGAHAPEWMIHSIPASMKMKGVNTLHGIYGRSKKSGPT